MATKKSSAKSKKPAATKKPRTCKTEVELRRLLAEAQAQVGDLLNKQGQQPLAQAELTTRLREIKVTLKELEPFDCDWYRS